MRRDYRNFSGRCLLLALLFLTGCATGPIRVELAPDASPRATEVAASRRVGVWGLQVSDARPNQQLLGPGVVPTGEIEVFTAGVLAEEPHLGDYLARDLTGSHPHEIKVEILRAYIRHVETNLEGVMVCRVSFWEDGQESEQLPRRVFRGQEVNMNWFGTDGEYRGVLSDCLRTIAAQMQETLKNAG